MQSAVDEIGDSLVGSAPPNPARVEFELIPINNFQH
jgi:hypothetical protein